MSTRTVGSPESGDVVPTDRAHNALPSGEPPKRFLVQPSTVTTSPTDPSVLAGKSLTLFGGGVVAEELAGLLTAHGALVTLEARTRVLNDEDGRVDGVLYLEALSNVDDPVLPDAFPTFQAALGKGLRWLLAVAPADHCGPVSRSPGATAGLRGFFRSVAREYPDTVSRLVEVDPADNAAVAAVLVGELLESDENPVVSNTGGTREVPELVESPLGSLALSGAGPAGDGVAEAAALGLDRESVVLLLGGARGITAQFASLLAGASGCALELVGRTALPGEPEPPSIAEATDLPALRAALANLARTSPSEIDRDASRILAQREVACALEELRGRSSAVRYHTVDVRDPDAVQQVVKEVYAEHGRLDGVVYAAGVIEDRLLAEKDEASFRRVFDTKVEGARALLAGLDDLPRPPAFVTLFGSIAAVLGNRGQADYAAANDALESLGAEWSAQSGNRTLTVHWGPWAPKEGHGGMVTPELGKSYARRGISLIDPEEGTLSLLRELAWGEAPAVVYTASPW
jgi:NAD(P)-dependent dehydrogenase (short-subunit alcohol dehydrogenase family)